MDDYKVNTIMSTDVLSVDPYSPLSEITKLMAEQHYSCLLVVQDNKPLGIITERDIVNFLSERLIEGSLDLEYKNLPLALDLMSGDLIMLYEEQDVLDALVISAANKIRHLPVIDSNGFLSGVVTYTDIANFQMKYMEYQSMILQQHTERTAELVETNKKLKEISLIDPLLGIGNRRAMEIDLKCTHDLSKRYADDYAIAMLDIDNFKLYNDHYGHQAGDNALQQVTNSIKSTIRSSDRIYRYGGEELLLLLPQTSSNDAETLAQRILFELESLNIPHCKSSFECVTVSCGLGVYSSHFKKENNEWGGIIKSADDALYVAKNNGRNKVSVS